MVFSIGAGAGGEFEVRPLNVADRSVLASMTLSDPERLHARIKIF